MAPSRRSTIFGLAGSLCRRRAAKKRMAPIQYQGRSHPLSTKRLLRAIAYLEQILTEALGI
jgi:hypothetical protein